MLCCMHIGDGSLSLDMRDVLIEDSGVVVLDLRNEVEGIPIEDRLASTS